MIEYVIADLFRGIIALFIIVDPVGNIPIFVGLTEKMKAEEKRKTFRTATIVGLILLLARGGSANIESGITTHSFMIAGGILLLIISVKILIYGGWKETIVSPESVGAVPIACPLLVGPGAITTTILTLQTAGIVVTVASVAIIFALVWLILRFIDPIYRFLGKTGSVVIARIMAMFIAAITTGYILDGIGYFLQQ